MKQYAALDDTVYFWFAANDTSGSGGDGATPAADVRLAGAAADAAPVYSPTPVLLSHVGYPAGAYEIAIAATAGNGFGANNTYAIFCTLAIDAQNPTGFVGSFDLKPVKATLDGEKVALSDATETQIDDIETDVELIKGIGFPEVKKLELAAGEEWVYGINIHGDFLYAECATSPGKIIKVALADFREVDSLTFNAGENTPLGEIPIVGDFLYVGCSSGHLVKIDLITFSEVDSISLTGNNLFSVCADENGDFLYTVNIGVTPGISKVSIATFTEVDFLSVTADKDACVIIGSQLYTLDATSPGKVIKIDLNTFTIDAILTLSSGNNLAVGITGDSRGYIYIGLELSPGRIVKISTTTFTEVATLILSPTEDVIRSLNIGENHLYAATNSTPAKIIVIDLETFMVLSSFTTDDDYDYIYRNTVLYGGFLFGGCSFPLSPGKVLGVPLSIWQHTSEIHGKLPTNYIMGSAVKTDKDDEIDRILTATEVRQVTVNDATATTTKFITNLIETDNTFWERAAIRFTSGNNEGLIRAVKNYNGSTKEIQIQTPLIYAPANNDKFIIVVARKFLTPDIGDMALESTLTAMKGSGWTDETLKAIKAAIDAEVGPGALSCTWTQKDADENPMDNVQIWITTDEAGVNVIAGTLLTNAHGKATFMLDAGTYYVWREKAGKNFTNPQTWSVS